MHSRSSSSNSSSNNLHVSNGGTRVGSSKCAKEERRNVRLDRFCHAIDRLRFHRRGNAAAPRLHLQLGHGPTPCVLRTRARSMCHARGARHAHAGAHMHDGGRRRERQARPRLAGRFSHGAVAPHILLPTRRAAHHLSAALVDGEAWRQRAERVLRVRARLVREGDARSHLRAVRVARVRVQRQAFLVRGASRAEEARGERRLGLVRRPRCLANDVLRRRKAARVVTRTKPPVVEQLVVVIVVVVVVDVQAMQRSHGAVCRREPLLLSDRHRALVDGEGVRVCDA